jgi:hypothetical protein
MSDNLLRFNQIGDAGTKRLAGVLGQCTTLAYLEFGSNSIDADGDGRLRGSWRFITQEYYCGRPVSPCLFSGGRFLTVV